MPPERNSRTRTNRSFAEDYLTWLRDTRGRSPATLYGYSIALDMFLDFLEPRRLTDATLADLEAFVGRARGGRAQGASGKAATRAREVSVLRGLYSFLVARGHVTANPALDLMAPRISNRHPKPIDDSVWRRLWGADLDVNERAAYGLGFFAGLRRSEIADLDCQHIRRHRLVGFTRKGGGDDVMDLGELAGTFEELMPQLGAELFLPALDKAEPPLVVSAIDLNRLMSERCITESLPHLTPHQLRHSFVTNLLRAGVPMHIVTELANHSSPSVTWRYAKVGGGALREWRRGL